MYDVMHSCSTTQYQRTALHGAIERGHCEIAQLLLENGADPNARDEVSVLLKSSLYPTTCHSARHICIIVFRVSYRIFLLGGGK